MTFEYPNIFAKPKPTLENINLTIKKGSFVTLCGPSGCGKTTLLRQLKKSITPHGTKSGKIYFEGTLLEELSARDSVSKIGFVFQSPDNQIVTDKVWHELAFGLESLGIKTPEIRLRVAEMASFFGIQTWFHKSVTELSGGQKQLLALASVMVLQPSVLILDEPTSQLDPIAAGEFLATVGKINRELGVTVILTEHRLEEALPLSSHAVVMDGGRVITEGFPNEVGLALFNQQGNNHGMFLAMPTPMRIWAACTDNLDEHCPITVKEGATWISSQKVTDSNYLTDEKTSKSKNLSGINANTSVDLPAIVLKDVWFRYEKNMPDVIKGLSFKAHFGEITAILGGNGTGKTTALSLIGGLRTPYRGNIQGEAEIYSLPQNPQSLFVSKTVRKDLLESLSESKISKEEKNRRLAVMVKLCRLEGLLDSHPYDLSGGEQQRTALAKVLLLQPKILLLDEPTKGLDAEYKQIFAAILRKMANAGGSIIMVSHDVEFCAEYADRCALFFDGSIVSENTPREFFSGNSFYTTSTNRMTRHVLSDAITVSDAIQALKGRLPPTPKALDIDAEYEISENSLPNLSTPLTKPVKLSTSRKWAFFFFSLWLIVSMAIATLSWNNLSAFIGGGHEAITIANERAIYYIGIMLALTVGIIGITFALSWKRGETGLYSKPQKQKLSKRTMVATVIILLTIPLTIYFGIHFFEQRRFYFISTLIIFQTMLPFALVFEDKKPQVRELIIIAVLCAIGVAGRSAFIMLPQFKPVISMVIISGVAFGSEAGFLVGAMTFLVSNMFFGQGPWTPWQMFASGIIGFLAGILFRKGLLRRTPISLTVYGGFATFFIYGGIMNLYNLLIMQPNPTLGMLLAQYLQGIPFDIVHAVATVFFLLITAQPMLEKLDRIKLKYGLVE